MATMRELLNAYDDARRTDEAAGEANNAGNMAGDELADGVRELLPSGHPMHCHGCDSVLGFIRAITGPGTAHRATIRCTCGAINQITYHRKGCGCTERATDGDMVDCVRLKQGCEDQEIGPESRFPMWVTSMPREAND